MRILITGASGFVGSHLGCRLQDTNHEILGIAHRSPKPLPFPFTRVDLRKLSNVTSVLHSCSPDVIVHAAACSRVLDCEDNPEFAREVNVEATCNIANWAAANNARLIFISSDQVFSGATGYYRESDPPAPLHVYGETKAEAERAVLNASEANLVIRSNSVIGPSLGWGQSFSDWIAIELRAEKQLTLFHDQFRSPIHVRTLTDILIAACERPLRGILHAGGPERLSRLETGFAVARAYGLNTDFIQSVSYRTHPRSDVMHFDGSFDISYLQTVLSDIPIPAIEDELAMDRMQPAGVL